jgi:hypothetical protein
MLQLMNSRYHAPVNVFCTRYPPPPPPISDAFVQVDVTAENAAFLQILLDMQQTPDVVTGELNTDGSRCAACCFFAAEFMIASSPLISGISFVEWQMSGQRYFKKALVTAVRLAPSISHRDSDPTTRIALHLIQIILRPARASRFISSHGFSEAFHLADGDKDKLITEDEMVILIEKVHAAAQAFIDFPEPEARVRLSVACMPVVTFDAVLH